MLLLLSIRGSRPLALCAPSNALSLRTLLNMDRSHLAQQLFTISLVAAVAGATSLHSFLQQFPNLTSAPPLNPTWCDWDSMAILGVASGMVITGVNRSDPADLALPGHLLHASSSALYGDGYGNYAQCTALVARLNNRETRRTAHYCSMETLDGHAALCAPGSCTASVISQSALCQPGPKPGECSRPPHPPYPRDAPPAWQCTICPDGYNLTTCDYSNTTGLPICYQPDPLSVLLALAGARVPPEQIACGDNSVQMGWGGWVVVTAFCMSFVIGVACTVAGQYTTDDLSSSWQFAAHCRRACDLLSNWNELLSTTAPPGRVRCLDGLRVISMFWLILGNTLYFGTRNNLNNPYDLYPPRVDGPPGGAAASW